MLRMSSTDFENARLKNEHIRNCQSHRVIYVNKDRIPEEKLDMVCEYLEMGTSPVAVLLAGEGECTEVQSVEMLVYYGAEIVGLAFERKLLQQSGSFNELLEDGTNFELLCRLLERENRCGISWIGGAESAGLSEKKMLTWAYVLRRNLQKLQELGCMNDLFQAMCMTAMEQGVFAVFQENVNKLLSNDAEYDKIRENTAPFIIVRGNETCAGVLQGFADALAEAMIGLGQAVSLWSAENMDLAGMDGLCKGMIGFQSGLFGREVVHKIQGKKFQFWLDYPAPFGEMFAGAQDMYILCQDGFHGAFIRDYFGVPNALHFPPAGMDIGMADNPNRPYDIVFVGSYFPVQEEFEDIEKQIFYEYMCEHSDKTFDQGLREWLEQQEQYPDKDAFVKILVEMRSVYRSVIGFWRKKVIDVIMQAGCELHVYGDSWYDYLSGAQPEYKTQLVIHPEVQAMDGLRELGKAKIGLNIMSWHKAGMTERVANIMLSGAVCVTERTTYLEEHFNDGEEMVGFSLDNLEELPKKLKHLLEDGKKRCQIAERAYQKASKEHVWRDRAEKILKMI